MLASFASEEVKDEDEDLEVEFKQEVPKKWKVFFPSMLWSNFSMYMVLKGLIYKLCVFYFLHMVLGIFL